MPSSKWSIRLHTILIGASPLIPIPFLDRLLGRYLRRHLVADIARGHNRRLSKAEIRQLAEEPTSGLLGVLNFLIVIPLQELYQEIFFWLEWKRGIDLATQTYYFGYLLNDIFARDDFTPQNAQIYRQAIKESLLGFQTERTREVIRKSFFSSRTVVREVRNWLFQFGKYYLRLITSSIAQNFGRVLSIFRRRKGPKGIDDQKLDDFFEREASQPKITHLIESLSKNLEAGNMPGHLEHLSRRLDERLKFYSDPQNLAYFHARRVEQSSIGIASLVASLLALSTVPLIVAAFYGQRYWDSSVLQSLAAWTPCFTAIMILMAAGTGFASLSERDNRNGFGVIGLLLSALTLLACCLIFGLVLISSSGLSG